ncbi:MAG TPA: TonB family protein, partial [Bdellovibrionota bacterium]|nr:TonB family protein [Bdellovibrionota bacterium]
TLAAVAALFVVSLILPKSDEVPVQETKIVFKRLVHGTMTAAPKGTGETPDPAAMGPQSEVGPKSDAAPKKASSDMGPKAVTEMGPKPDPKRKAEPKKIETAKAPSKPKAEPKAVAKKPEPAPKFKELKKNLAKSIARIVSKTESKPVVTKSATALSKPVPKALAKAAPKAVAKPQPVKKTDLSQTAVGRLLKASSLQSAARSIERGGVSGVKTSGSSDALPGGSSSSLDETAGVARGASVGARSVEVSSMGGAAGIAGDKDVGYGKGAHASVNGQGRSFVSLDPSGSDVAEGLTKDQVGAVIHRHMSEIRYCYEAAMIRSPDVEGKLAVKFVIGGAGSVKTAGVAQSSLGDPKLDDCVMQRLTRWKFPNPRGGVDVAVNYPFVFKTLGR